MSLLDTLYDYGGQAMDALDAPRRWLWEQTGYTPEDVLNYSGIDPDSWGGMGAKFVLNSVTDPLNLIPIPAVGVGKLLSKLRYADDVARGADDVARMADDFATAATQISPTDLSPVGVPPGGWRSSIEAALFDTPRPSQQGYQRSIEDALAELGPPNPEHLPNEKRLLSTLLGDLSPRAPEAGTVDYMSPEQASRLLPAGRMAPEEIARALQDLPGTVSFQGPPLEKLVEGGGYLGHGVQDISGPEGGLLQLLKASDSEIARDLAKVPPELIENPNAFMAPPQRSSFFANQGELPPGGGSSFMSQDPTPGLLRSLLNDLAPDSPNFGNAWEQYTNIMGDLVPAEIKDLPDDILTQLNQMGHLPDYQMPTRLFGQMGVPGVDPEDMAKIIRTGSRLIPDDVLQNLNSMQIQELAAKGYEPFRDSPFLKKWQDAVGGGDSVFDASNKPSSADSSWGSDVGDFLGVGGSNMSGFLRSQPGTESGGFNDVLNAIGDALKSGDKEGARNIYEQVLAQLDLTDPGDAARAARLKEWAGREGFGGSDFFVLPGDPNASDLMSNPGGSSIFGDDRNGGSLSGLYDRSKSSLFNAIQDAFAESNEQTMRIADDLTKLWKESGGASRYWDI